MKSLPSLATRVSLLLAGTALIASVLPATAADDPLADLAEIAAMAELRSPEIIAACEAFLENHANSAGEEYVLFTLGKQQELTKKHQDAITTLSTFIERFADSTLITGAHMQRGEAYRLTEKSRESIPDFEKAYAGYHNSKNANAAHAMYHVAQAHQALGDKAAAKASYEILKANYPAASYTTNAARLVGVTAKPAGRATPKPSGPAVGTAAPDISFTHLDSESEKKLSDFKDKVVVIDFWASWCGPCQEPMAKMQTYREEHPDWGDKVELISISIDNTAKAAADHLAKNDWDKTYNSWAGEGGFKAKPPVAYGVSGIPSCFIVDAEGKVAASGHPTKLDIPALVEGLLGKK